MSAFPSIKKQEQSRVPNSQYIKTPKKPDEAIKTVEPVKPAQPDAK
jgi:hypothetical protein